jgi:hypothetical protein
MADKPIFAQTRSSRPEEGLVEAEAVEPAPLHERLVPLVDANRRPPVECGVRAHTHRSSHDAIVMKHKAHYVLHNDLGGIMFWELSGDTPDGELVEALAEGLSHGVRR